MPKSAYSRKHSQFRALLVEARKRGGLTQSAVARRLGRPQSYVSKYESGERRLDVVEFLEVTRALRINPITIISALEN